MKKEKLEEVDEELDIIEEGDEIGQYTHDTPPEPSAEDNATYQTQLADEAESPEPDDEEDEDHGEDDDELDEDEDD